MSYSSDKLLISTTNPYRCIDPSAPCVDDDDVTVDMVEGCGFLESVGEISREGFHPSRWLPHLPIDLRVDAAQTLGHID